MKGYFISEEIAQKMDLLNNIEFKENAQKTVIVITENDFKENGETEIETLDFSNFATLFYQEYYNSIIESFFSQYIQK